MDRVEKILENLNDRQLEAVKTTEGYVRVIAGAGSGKTKALTSRYAYIVEGLGINTSNILCVTFTNKAAQEMKNRVRKLIGQNLDLSYITTYHGFCVRVLREDINKIQYPKSFVIMDVEDQKTLLRQIFSELKITSKDLTFKSALKSIGKFKSKYENYIEYILDNKEIDFDNNIISRIFKLYLFKQKKNFALDFDDLVNYTFYIFDNFQDILLKWQKRLHYIQVDEMQDTSKRQYELITMLSNYHKNLFVVGDPDQTIYEWRGAIPEILVNFDKSFPDCKTIIMNENYRSTPEILNIANHIIKKNKIRVDKDLFTRKANGIKVIHFHAKNDIEESQWVVNEIKEIREKHQAKLSEITILYRAHHVSRNIEQSLIKENVPYTVFGGVRFFERKEIKDVLAYLRLIVLEDDMSFLRIINYPKRGLGKKYIEHIEKLSVSENKSMLNVLLDNIENKPFNKKGAKDFLEIINNLKESSKTLIVSDFVKKLLDKTEISKELRADGDEDRLANIQELINSIIFLEKENDEKLELIDYLQEIALYTNKDVLEEDDGKVNLMTIHTAKGLEYPYVFLCGFSDGILPSAMSIKDRKKRAIEEERRLTYVAITRAEKCFYITEAEGFNYSTGERKYPSRFLFDIEENMYVQKGNIDKLYLSQAKGNIAYEEARLAEEKLYKVGELVLHPVWGIGKITFLNHLKQEYTINFIEIEKTKPINFEYKLLKQAENTDKIQEIINKKAELKQEESEENFENEQKTPRVKYEVVGPEKEQEELTTKIAVKKILKEKKGEEPKIEKNIKAKIKRFAKNEYPDDKEMQDYIYKKQVKAFLYMENVSDIELKVFAISEYKTDYEMQQHIYDKNVIAKNYMNSVTDIEIKKIAIEEYPKDYEMQQYIYDKQFSAKSEMSKIPDSSLKTEAVNQYPKDYEMQIYIYNELKKDKIEAERIENEHKELIAKQGAKKTVREQEKLKIKQKEERIIKEQKELKLKQNVSFWNKLKNKITGK